ncbi:Large exoproteins involved in heme utilization or adhesion [Anaerovibrio sp. JC8]|nr:Large exoproteins involved in heme utilization or adhesion [Anaerovibrio sp. JC8]
MIGGRAGSGQNAYNNSVTLQGTAQISGNLYGGMQNTNVTSGEAGHPNILYLAGNAKGNDVNGVIDGFDVFATKNNFTFKNGETILSGSGIESPTQLNIAGENNNSTLWNDKMSAGTMTLFKITSGNGRFTDNIVLTYRDDSGTVKSGGYLTTDRKTIRTINATGNNADSIDNGVKLGHISTHTVNLTEVTTTYGTYKQKIDYNITNELKTVNLSNWNGTTDSTTLTNWTRGSSAVTVSGTISDAAKTAVGTGKATILTGDAGIFAGASIPTEIAYGDKGDFSDAIGTTGVTLSGDKMGGVKVEADDTKANAKLTYYAETKEVTTANLGTMTWGTTATPTGYKFVGGNSGTTINDTNLAFGKTDTLIENGTRTLLNASGLNSNNPITTNTNKNIAIENTDAYGIKYNATATGKAVAATNAVNFTVSSVTLDSVDLLGWNKNTSTTPLPSTWLKKDGGVSVEGNFSKPGLDPGQYKVILTSTQDLFSNANIDASIKYTDAGTFDDTVNGVTLSGNRAGGVKAEDSGKKLTYYAEKFDVNTVSLGDMKWDTPRKDISAYDFAGVTNINASGLTFTGTADAPNDTTNLITGAKNLSDTITPLNNAKVAAEFTDNNIVYKGTGTGNVSLENTANGTNVKYTITGGTISSMNLNGWTGTQNMNLPTSWTGTNIAVETGNFASLAADKTLFNNLGANTFGTVSGSKAYKSGERVTDDTQNGVTLAGSKTGGIKAEDSGATLKYYAESMAVDAITLGEMKWGTGRNITGTGYTFNNVGNNGVDASKLTFTFDGATSVNDVTAGDHWGLLTNANGLAANLKVKGSPVSQKISHGINNAANLTGTLKGDVTTGDGIVQYAVTSKTLETVDISKWDGSSTGTVNSTWGKLDSGIIAVTGSGFKTPTAVGDYDILTRNTAGFFTGAKIDDSIKYQPSAAYSETEKNITISGKQAKGVQASNDGTALQYSVGAAYIDTIGLGKVTYNKDAVLVDKSSAMYNFSNVKTLDKSGFGVTMTDDQKKTAAANDSMTLVKANNTLNNIGAQDTGKLNYTYTANPGLTVKGAVTGNVSATGGNVLYTVSSNKASDLNVGKLGWNSTYARPNTEIAYSDAFVNAENVFFTGVSALNKGDTMKLVSNFGDSVNKTRAGIFTLDNGKTGKGHAYWDSATKSLMYVVDRGVDEQVAPVEAVKVETTIDGENPHKGDVPGGKAEGDGEAKDNETKVKNSHIQKNDDGTGGDANGGTSENGNANKNKLNVEDSEIDGDANGGQSDTGNTEENEVIIKRGTIHGTVTGGETLGGHGGSKGNTTTVEGSTVDGDVNGGKTGGSGNTEENHVILTGSKVGGDVNGGHSGGSGGSKGNETTLDGTEVGGDVNGGKTDGDGETKENKVDIKNGSKIGGNVTGGRSGGNGDSTDNETTVEGKSQVDGDVTGGQSEKGNANKNETTVTEGSKVGGDVTGGKSNGDGTSNENKTTVSGGSEIGGNVVGGHSKNGDTNQNETTVTGGSKVEKDVIGGQNEGKGTSNENKATVDGSTVGGNVTGGQSESGNTGKNETKVSGKSKVTGDVTGGKTNSGTSSENKATVEGGSEVGGSVVGGQSTSGNTSKNEATVTGGSKVDKDVIGGKTGSGTSSENKATVEGSTVGGSVVGGQSESGTSVQNTVNVTNSNVGGSVMGGYSKEGAVSTNEASVSGGSVGGSVYGGKTDGTGVAASNNVTLDGDVKVKGAVYGGYSENGTADGNVVTVKKATVDDYVYGGKSKIRSSNDLVYFHDGTVLGIIGGGCDEAVSNSVSLLKGGVTEHVIGGFATSTATNNTVNVLGGEVKGSVIGGYGGTSTADNNTVNLGGGTVTGNTITSETLGVTIDGGVYGGYSVSGTTQNNTVNLFGTADVSNTGIFGGNLQYNGNTLNIGYSGTPWTGGEQKVKSIKNFEAMNFTVVPWSKSKAAVTVTDDTNSDLSMTTVSAKNVEFTGVKVVAKDDTMTLLDQSAVTNKAVNVNEDSDFTIGIAVEGTGKVALDENNNVVYNVKSVRATEQTHNTLMGAEATMTTLNVGNDYIGSAVDGLALPENTGKDGLATFAKLGGGKLTQETGSHIDVSTWNAILALGHKNVKKHSTFEYGAFFEYGNGNYTTYNDAAQRGDGSTRYTGGGLLAKWYTPKGLYVEGSLRAGTVHEDANGLLRDNMGNAYSYNTDTGYYGFHVGVGRELKLDRHTVLDVYAKYFYNHRNGTDFTVAGADYRLDDITSSLLRVGARYTEKRDDQWSFYGGLAYEYEMCGRAYGTVNGLDIRGADIGGGRIRGEIGAFIKPTADTPWGVDLNLTAYAGKKQGVMGSISTVYTF